MPEICRSASFTMCLSFAPLLIDPSKPRTPCTILLSLQKAGGNPKLRFMFTQSPEQSPLVVPSLHLTQNLFPFPQWKTVPKTTSGMMMMTSVATQKQSIRLLLYFF